MVKIAIILFRNDQPLEEQHRWWLEDHVPIVRTMPGLRGYTINLSDKGEDGSDPEIAGTDYLEFDDWDSARAAYNSPEWQRAREHTAASGAKTLRTWIRETHHILESA